jgi:hypothetical protein
MTDAPAPPEEDQSTDTAVTDEPPRPGADPFAYTGPPEYKIKNTTLPGTPVTEVMTAGANAIWTAKGWVAGLTADVITPRVAGSVVGLVSMSIAGTPPAGFAGTAEVVDYPTTKAVWTGKGWA